MKSCSILLVALGLVSSAALAQSAQPVPEPSPGSMPAAGATAPPAGPGRLPPPSMESGTQAPAEDAGAMSSGAPAGQMAPAGGGQLITPDIAQSRPTAATSGIGVKPQTKDGVTYLCGGIGKEEADYMKQAAKDYDLMMTFAEKNGDYVADVGVTIKNARGKTVLDTRCDAPILLVDLPSGGSYRIHADAGGRGLDRTAVVKAGKGRARQITLVWPHSAPAASKQSAGAGRGSSGSDIRDRESSGGARYDSERSGRGDEDRESTGGESSGSESGNEGYSGEDMR